MMKSKSASDQKSYPLPRRILEYLIFWTVSMYVLANFFSYGDSVERIDWIYTLLFHISIWFGISLNSFFLIPRLLATGKVVWYIIGIMVLLQLMIMLNQFTFNVLADYVFPGYFFISYYEWHDLLNFMIAFLGITSLIQFSRSWFRESQTQKMLTEIKKSKTEMELQTLKAQVHPHFLFNSLNTIYGLIRKNPVRAADAVLLLAELLRYTVRQAGTDLVPLHLEIDYITKYAEFHKMRLDHSVGIEVNVHGNIDTVLIAPLILIPFVENAFKYGEDEIQITIDRSDSEVHFKCTNRIRSDVGFSEMEGNGTGLTNVRKRLALMYEHRHQLDIIKNNDYFMVDLRVQYD